MPPDPPGCPWIRMVHVCITGNVQGLIANQIAALSTEGVLFPKSIQNMSEISEVSEVRALFL